jgi:hypothetical protein
MEGASESVPVSDGVLELPGETDGLEDTVGCRESDGTPDGRMPLGS